MAVLAIYRHRIYEVADNLAVCELVGGPTVSYGDAGLVVDPTDAQLAEAENLGAFFCVDGAALERLREELRRGR